MNKPDYIDEIILDLTKPLIKRNPSKAYILPGDPTPLARPRFAKNHVYDSQQSEKEAASLIIKHQHNHSPLLKGSLILDVTFFMPLPISWSDKKRNEQFRQFHSYKPDTSNLLKFIEDICTGIIYNDDSQISYIIAKKIYAFEPCTKFTVTELEDERK